MNIFKEHIMVDRVYHVKWTGAQGHATLWPAEFYARLSKFTSLSTGRVAHLTFNDVMGIDEHVYHKSMGISAGQMKVMLLQVNIPDSYTEYLRTYKAGLMKKEKFKYTELPETAWVPDPSIELIKYLEDKYDMTYKNKGGGIVWKPGNMWAVQSYSGCPEVKMRELKHLFPPQCRVKIKFHGMSEKDCHGSVYLTTKEDIISKEYFKEFVNGVVIFPALPFATWDVRVRGERFSETEVSWIHNGKSNEIVIHLLPEYKWPIIGSSGGNIASMSDSQMAAGMGMIGSIKSAGLPSGSINEAARQQDKANKFAECYGGSNVVIQQSNQVTGWSENVGAKDMFPQGDGMLMKREFGSDYGHPPPEPVKSKPSIVAETIQIKQRKINKN